MQKITIDITTSFKFQLIKLFTFSIYHQYINVSISILKQLKKHV